MMLQTLVRQGYDKLMISGKINATPFQGHAHTTKQNCHFFSDFLFVPNSYTSLQNIPCICSLFLQMIIFLSPPYTSPHP